VERVLVTGSAGVIGRIACRALLQRGHAVRGLDLQPSPDGADSRVGSIADRDTVRRACKGMTAVVHLAATPDDDDFLSLLLPNNITGVYHVLEAAREQGLRRVVLASSCQVVMGLRHRKPGRPLRVEDGVAPANLYAATKVFAEAAGEVYARQHGLTVIAVRIGWLPRTASEAAACGKGGNPIYTSHDDAGRFFVAAIEVPFTGWLVTFLTSNNGPRSAYDLAPAKAALGFEPVDVYPAGLPPEWGLAPLEGRPPCRP
jgi:nucleoside-diphosphate-sugar epimerase